MSERILITGAGGFIGSHLVEQCLRRGYQVRAMLRYGSQGHIGALRWLPPDLRPEFFFGDLRDSETVDRAVEGCSAVIHLGALISIPYSYEAPDSYVQTNVAGTEKILQACRKFGVRRVIVTSTSEVYGSAQHVPMTEEHPLMGQSPYAASKIAADQIALSFHRSFDTPVVIVRPFNTFGPRQSIRAVLPNAITQILGGARVIKLGRLDTTRDFTFVTDTCSAFIAALSSDNCVGEVINLGTGEEISIEHAIGEISRIVGSPIQTEVDASRLRPSASEVVRLCSDNTKAKKLLNWRPVYEGREGFREALRLNIEWYSRKEHLQAFQTERGLK